MTKQKDPDSTNWNELDAVMGDMPNLDDMPTEEELEAMQEQADQLEPQEPPARTEQTSAGQKPSSQAGEQEATTQPLSPPYRSPVIEETDQSHLPHPAPICEECALSMWYQQDAQLLCYCSRMHTITWRPDQKETITRCDGQILTSRQLAAAAQPPSED